MPTQREFDRLRVKAEKAIDESNKLMRALLWAFKHLVETQNIHFMDDYGHCAADEEEWPCKTTKQLREISMVWDKVTSETEEAEQ